REPRVLPGRVQHRGARARPPLPPLLAARLRAGAREPLRRARPRRCRGRRTVPALTLTVGAGAARPGAFLHRPPPALPPPLAHRLASGTSGLLVAARTRAAHQALRAALHARAVEKRYLAWVAGDASALDGTRVALPLAHDPRDRRRMVPAAAGMRAWPAETS